MEKVFPNLKYVTSDNKDDETILKGIVAQHREVQIPLPLVFHTLVLRGFTKKQSWEFLRRLQRTGKVYVSRNFVIILKTECEKNEC